MLRANCTRAQVQRLKEFLLTITEDEDQGLVSSEEVWTSPLYSSQRLVSQSQRSRKDLYKAVEGPCTRPIVLSMITTSNLRRRRCFIVFEPDETKFAALSTLLSLYTRSPSNFDESSEYDLKNFQNVFFKTCDLKPCVKSFEVICMTLS